MIITGLKDFPDDIKKKIMESESFKKFRQENKYKYTNHCSEIMLPGRDTCVLPILESEDK